MSGHHLKKGGRDKERKERKKWDKKKIVHNSTKYTNFNGL